MSSVLGMCLIFFSLFACLFEFYWNIVDIQHFVSFRLQQSDSVIHIHFSFFF